MIRLDSCTINRIECIFQSWFMVALSPHVSRLNGVIFPINCTVSLQVTHIYSYLTFQQLGEVGR